MSNLDHRQGIHCNRSIADIFDTIVNQKYLTPCWLLLETDIFFRNQAKERKAKETYMFT